MSTPSKLEKFRLHLEEPEPDLPQLTINIFDYVIFWWKNRKEEK